MIKRGLVFWVLVLLSWAACVFPPESSNKKTRPDPLRERLRHVEAFDNLVKAAENGDVGRVKALLASGVDPNGRHRVVPRSALGLITFPDCPINRADPASRDAIVTALLSAGADPNFVELERIPVLVGAAEACPRPVIEALVKAGAKLDAVGMGGITALPIALTKGNLDAAEALVDLGARLSARERAALYPQPPKDPRLKAVLARAVISAGT